MSDAYFDVREWQRQWLVHLEEILFMASSDARPDGRPTGDLVSDSIGRDGDQPAGPRTGGYVDLEADVCDRGCCHPGVVRIDPLDPHGLVVRAGLFSGGRMELDAAVIRLHLEGQ